MLVWVIGLLTEAEFLTFTISAGIANLIVFAPLCVLGLLADNLGDAFSHGDGVSIAILCFSKHNVSVQNLTDSCCGRHFDICGGDVVRRLCCTKRSGKDGRWTICFKCSSSNSETK